MLEAEAATMFGSKVFESEDFVVRAMVKEGKLKVHAHDKSATGMELIPRGYMLGNNCLIMEKR